jgi:4-methyl-5(b-hydroxyethyl)-thiazole monophosphate biosynthesis
VAHSLSVGGLESKRDKLTRKVCIVLRVTDKGVFVLLAPGFEETDVFTVTRTLRRTGVPVAVVGLTANPVPGAYGLSLAPDWALSEVEAERPQAVVLPGAIQAARKLNADPRVHVFLRRVADGGGYVVAFDTAYAVLRSAGLLSHGESSREGRVTKPIPARYGEGLPLERVLVEGRVIWGRDSGAAQEAALTLVSLMES